MTANLRSQRPTVLTNGRQSDRLMPLFRGRKEGWDCLRTHRIVDQLIILSVNGNSKQTSEKWYKDGKGIRYGQGPTAFLRLWSRQEYFRDLKDSKAGTTIIGTGKELPSFWDPSKNAADHRLCSSKTLAGFSREKSYFLWKYKAFLIDLLLGKWFPWEKTNLRVLERRRGGNSKDRYQIPLSLVREKKQNKLNRVCSSTPFKGSTRFLTGKIRCLQDGVEWLWESFTDVHFIAFSLRFGLSKNGKNKADHRREK